MYVSHKQIRAMTHEACRCRVTKANGLCQRTTKAIILVASSNYLKEDNKDEQSVGSAGWVRSTSTQYGVVPCHAVDE